MRQFFPATSVVSLICAGLLALSLLHPFAQVVSPWAPGTPPPFLQGPTLGATISNGVQASSAQSRVTAQTASRMGDRAQDFAYQMQNLLADYQNLQMQFQNLQTTFNAVANLAMQLNSPSAANAATELESGLGIIAEAFTPVQEEIQAGSFNRDDVVHMCQVLNEALNVWQDELNQCSQRLGAVQ